MPDCEICSEFPVDNPRFDIHPATHRIETSTGDEFDVCAALLTEVQAGYAEDQIHTDARPL